jgi:hypothetical protein
MGAPNSLSNIFGASAGLAGVEDGAEKSNLSFLNDELIPVEGLAPPTPSSSSHSYVGSQLDQNVIQTLVDRVEKLESMLAATSLGGKDGLTSCRTEIPARRDLDRNFLHKTRCYGQSHWVHPFEQVRRLSHPKFRSNNLQAQKFMRIDFLPKAGSNLQLKSGDTSGEVNSLVDKCKVMARTIKAANAPQWPSFNPDLHEGIPPREVSDELIRLYLRTSEVTCRIVHIPSFWKEYEQYWTSPQSTSPVSAFKILLVMAIGICYYQGPEQRELRNKAQQWIYAAQSWLAMPHEKCRLNISGVQVQCLLLSCRAIYNIGGDLVWITAGTLLRTAINMGFHRDPKYFPRISILHAEIRRRLWATILELNLLTSLDAGMTPMVSFDDFNTEPPLNIDDDEIDESTIDPPTPKPSNVATQVSIQLAVLKSLKLRLKINCLINDFRFEPTYEEVIQLSTELIAIYKENHKFVSQASEASSPGNFKPTPLHRKLLDLTTQRFLIALHRPFAFKARSDPKYYYSRKVYLDSALAILAHPDSKREEARIPLETEIQDDYNRLRIVNGGFLKEVMIHAAIVVYLEMVVPLEEDPDLTFTQERNQSREPYRRLLEDTLEISRQRIAVGGETNVKGHLFMSVMMGHLDALESGRPSEDGILEAAQSSARLCYDMMRARLPSTPDMNVTQEFGSGDGSNTDQTILDMPNSDVDFTMADWGMDFENIPDSWMFSGWDEGIPGMSTNFGQ